MLFYTTFAIRTFTVSLNEIFENYTVRHTHVYSGRMTRLKYPPWLICFSNDNFVSRMRPSCLCSLTLLTSFPLKRRVARYVRYFFKRIIIMLLVCWDQG